MTTVPTKQLSGLGTIATQNASSVSITGGSVSGLTLVATAGVQLLSTGEIQTIGVGNGSVSGNARGIGAIDLQTSRALATQVASGAYSFVVGSNNTANTTNAIAIGDSNVANQVNSIVTGNQGISRYHTCHTHGISGFSSTAGTAQTHLVMLRGETTDATLTELLTPARWSIAANRTFVFDILITARRAATDDESAGFRVTGVIDRNAATTSVALVGSVTKTVLGRDHAAWDVTVDADPTLGIGSLRVRVQGESGKTIRWVAFGRLVEVSGA